MRMSGKRSLYVGLVYSSLSSVVIDAGFTLMHPVSVPMQLPWQQEPLCNATLRLLLQLRDQLFPFSGKRRMLSAQILQQLGHALCFLRALIDPERFLRTGDGTLQPRNLFLDKAAALLQLAQLDRVKPATLGRCRVDLHRLL